MRIAITGCSGDIGKYVVKRALAQNFTVVGIDINAPNSDLSHEGVFSFIKVDLTNYEATLKALEHCEGIVHLAAIPRPRDFGVTTHNWCVDVRSIDNISPFNSTFHLATLCYPGMFFVQQPRYAPLMLLKHLRCSFTTSSRSTVLFWRRQ